MPDSLIIDILSILQDTLVVTLPEQKPENSQLTTNILTIGLALVAAFIALYQVKLNIISSARIRWIENLKENISEYCVIIEQIRIHKHYTVYHLSKTSDSDIKEKISEESYKEYTLKSAQLDILKNKILLNLNSDESLHKNIEAILNRLANITHSTNVSDEYDSEVGNLIDRLIEESKEVFKTEWKKTKRIFKI